MSATWLFELCVAHRLELMARDDTSGGEEAELPGDGLGGERMIAGDHHGRDAGPLACLHRCPCFGPRRIHDADQAKQRHVLLGVRRESRAGFRAIARTRKPSLAIRCSMS